LTFFTIHCDGKRGGAIEEAGANESSMTAFRTYGGKTEKEGKRKFGRGVGDKPD